MDGQQIQFDLWLQKAKELYNIQQQKKSLESKEKTLAAQLKMIQKDEAMSFGGIRYFYEERLGTIDYASIPELKEINLEQYRKPIIKVWKLAVESI